MPRRCEQAHERRGRADRGEQGLPGFQLRRRLVYPLAQCARDQLGAIGARRHARLVETPRGSLLRSGGQRHEERLAVDRPQGGDGLVDRAGSQNWSSAREARRMRSQATVSTG